MMKGRTRVYMIDNRRFVGALPVDEEETKRRKDGALVLRQETPRAPGKTYAPNGKRQRERYARQYARAVARAT